MSTSEDRVTARMAIDAMTYRIGSQAILTLDPGADIRSESGLALHGLWPRGEPALVVIARCKRKVTDATHQ